MRLFIFDENNNALVDTFYCNEMRITPPTHPTDAFSITHTYGTIITEHRGVLSRNLSDVLSRNLPVNKFRLTLEYDSYTIDEYRNCILTDIQSYFWDRNQMQILLTWTYSVIGQRVRFGLRDNLLPIKTKLDWLTLGF